jgi:hypothetical protein
MVITHQNRATSIHKIIHKRERLQSTHTQKEELLHSLEMTRPLKGFKHGNNDYKVGMIGHKDVI